MQEATDGFLSWLSLMDFLIVCRTIAENAWTMYAWKCRTIAEDPWWKCCGINDKKIQIFGLCLI